jgi:hypothetical protein
LWEREQRSDVVAVSLEWAQVVAFGSPQVEPGG